MGVTAEKFDPARASAAEVRAYHEVTLGRYADDRPLWTPPTLEEIEFRLRTPFQGLGPTHHWAARLDGELVAFAGVNYADWEDLALAEVVVHPRARRRGIGTALVRALLPDLEARGRTQVEGWQVTRGGAGAGWLAGLGFHTFHSMIVQKLTLTEVDRGLWDVPVPPGHRLERWISRVPEDLLESYAAARNAIQDAPVGDQHVSMPTWTSTEVRAAEEDYLARGAEQRVVVAVREADGAVVGLTELELHDERPHRGFQRDTTVLPAHRGLGLGRCVKAHMLRWLAADRPRLTEIVTGTGSGNVHMARINHSIGFTTISDINSVRASVADLRAKTAGQRA
ncbi:GNAT family N-acetyltransferase [Lentzea sp. JNUCC 0626]|uniref:GNAT family N-acetyltransferase n=1 Tax=Lentzea sp. JNUCC 0626 TaxID=3367513 RepID=UPI003748B780